MQPAFIVTMALIGTGLFHGGAEAAQTQPSQAPGFYRLSVGDFTVIALNDGVVPYRTEQLLPTATPEQIRTSLFEAGLTEPWGMSYNAFLVDTGEKQVLIDTGSGGKLADSPFFAGTGRLLANLRAAGYRPEDIDEIYITHLGPDHVGGLTQGKERVFPNAILRAAQSEVDVFLKPGAIPNPNDWRLGFWRGLFQPWIDAGRFQPFEADTLLTPGIRALATRGHTPGHTSYQVESGGQRILILGDLILVAALQFAKPELPTPFDADRPGGVAQRRRILELVTREDYLVAGAHLSFPGLGRVRADPKGYRWIPINYAIPEGR